MLMQENKVLKISLLILILIFWGENEEFHCKTGRDKAHHECLVPRRGRLNSGKPDFTQGLLPCTPAFFYYYFERTNVSSTFRIGEQRSQWECTPIIAEERIRVSLLVHLINALVDAFLSLRQSFFWVVFSFSLAPSNKEACPKAILYGLGESICQLMSTFLYYKKVKCAFFYRELKLRRKSFRKI